MAKILARTEGTHEIVGGKGGGGSAGESRPAAAAAAAATTVGAINETVANSSRDNIEVPPVENIYTKAMPDAAGGAIPRDSGDEARTNCDGDGGSERDPLAEVEIKLEIDNAGDHFTACRAPREGGELKRTSTTPTCDLALAADVTETAACRAESTSRATASAGEGGGGGSLTAVGGKKLLNGLSKETTKERAAVVPTRSRSAKMIGAGSNASAATGAARPDVVAGAPSACLPSSRLRQLRRKLERLTAKAARTSAAPSEEDQEADRGGEAAKRVWDFISRVSLSSDCGSTSLENLYGDGITADSLVGLVYGLGYACGLDETVVAGKRAGGEGEGDATGWSNNEQASKVRRYAYIRYRLGG